MSIPARMEGSGARLLAAVLSGATTLSLLTGLTAAHAAPAPVTGQAVHADVSPPLRSIKPLSPSNGNGNPVRRRPSKTGVSFDLAPSDFRRQTSTGLGAALSMPSTFEGVGNVNAVVPPDTEGDVGLHDYVQWVNLSFEIFSKSGAVRYGPAAGNTLWSGFGGNCASTNQGDPVVLYDRLADRWIFSQFAFKSSGGNPQPPFLTCIAVSTTGDPTGSYFRYAFEVNAPPLDPNNFPDYPKFGVWPDGYYMSTNSFNGNTLEGAGAYAFDRTKMLAGDPTASFVGFQLPSQYEGILPSNLVGATPPPAGSPDYFGSVDTTGAGSGSTFQIWKFHADFATPANSALTGPTNVAVDPYTYSFCNSTNSQACIAQPGTNRKLDPLADRLLNRLEYRNFGDHESLVANHTVDVGANQAGVRWYEIRDPGSATPEVHQQGTFAPADGVSRWMGSTAMDGDGDMALGYSVSNSSTVNPGIRLAGRLDGDPLGTMPQAEQSMVTGGGSQTGTSRWGDYSAMAVDPVDDSTFWYTQEYYPSSSSASWHTRIGSFRLRTAPAVTVTSPAQGSSATAAPTFQGTASTAAGDSSTVTVKVYSGTALAGTPVETLSTTRDGGTRTWSVAASPPLGEGTYTVQASQVGSGGNTGYSTANSFTVDATAPAVTLTSPAGGALTNDSTPTFQGTGGTASGDLATITVKVYSGSSASGSPVQTLPTTRAAGGAWSVTASPALADGTYTAQAEQSDAAGNLGKSSASAFTIDATPPVVTLTSPAAGSSTKDSTPDFIGAAGSTSGDSASVTLNVYSGTTATGTPVESLGATRQGDGSWSVTASPALADGTYTARAEQSDTAGNTGSSNARTFTIDTVSPTVTLTGPANGASTNSTTPTFQGTAGIGTGDSTSVTVNVYSGTMVSGSPVQTRVATRAANGSWSVLASPGLGAGTYTAQATQTDVAGNTGTSGANTFTIDLTAPTVTITSPTGGSTTKDSTPTFQGGSGAGTGDSATVTVKVYSGSSASGTPVQTLPTTAVSGSWSVTASPALADGTYTAQAEQSDAAGNLGKSSAVTITVDTAVPVVSLTSPASGSSTNDTTPTFQGTGGTLSGDSTTVTVNVYSGSSVAGSPLESLPATRAGNGAWSVDAFPALGAGTYTAQATQSDAAGNTGSSTAHTFTVDLTAPTVTLTAPADGALTGDSTPTFQGAGGTATGDSTTVTVKVYSGSSASGSPVQTLPATRTGGSWSVTASPALTDGTYTAQAEQLDAAGNTGSSAAHTFTVDTTAPSIALTSPAAGSTTSDTTPDFQGTAGLATGDLAPVTVNVYSGTSASGSPVRALGATRQPDGSWSVTASPALTEGTYTAQATQSDSAGNTGTSNTRTFTIDTTAPVVTLTSPADGSSTSAAPTFQGAAGTLSGDSSTVTVKVYSGSSASGSPVETLGATRQPGGSWSVTAAPALALGTYTAQAEQSDAAANLGTSTAHTFTVTTPPPPNVPPTAAFGFSPASPLAGQAVAFDGTASSDSDGTIASYAWAFGDGATAGGPTPSHTYAGAGTYTVQLEVTDNSGGMGTTAEQVTVGSAVVPPPAVVPPAVVPPVVVTPQPVSAPRISLRVPKQKLGNVLSRGLRAFVTSDKSGTAKLQAVLAGRLAHSLGLAALRPVTVAHLSKRITTPGAAVKVVLKLSSRARRALAHARRTTLSLTLVVTSTGGRATTIHQKVVLHR